MSRNLLSWGASLHEAIKSGKMTNSGKLSRTCVTQKMYHYIVLDMLCIQLN